MHHQGRRTVRARALLASALTAVNGNGSVLAVAIVTAASETADDAADSLNHKLHARLYTWRLQNGHTRFPASHPPLYILQNTPLPVREI